MIALSPAVVLRFVLRIAVFLLIGPLVGGIVYEGLLFKSFGPPHSLFEVVAKFMFVIYCAYVLGWKAAVAAGVAMAALCPLIRYAAVAYAGSMAIGAAVGTWLVGLDFWIPQLDPVWRNAAICAFAAFVSTWAIYHDRFLRPTVGTHGSRGKTRGHEGIQPSA